MAVRTRPLPQGGDSRFRRSPHLVGYWREAELRLDQHARGTRSVVSPAVVTLLHAFDRWRTVAEVCTRVPEISPDEIAALVPRLLARGLIVEEGRPPDPADEAADTWAPWNPAAGFFHQATRDVAYWPRARATEYLRARAAHDPPPPPVLRLTRPGRAVVPLPMPGRRGRGHESGISTVLRARRTWRRFGPGRVTLDEASTLLGLTWGVQAWVEITGFGRMPLKTAPSGGARHSVEAFVAVRRVTGVAPGLYHYDAESHALVQLQRGLPAAALAGCFPEQAWMGRAPLVVFMAAIFGRAQWRYPFPRAYRTLLAETGHHGQSFCLLATALDLAPFCTMAFADSHVERMLGLDGYRAGVLYAVGAGRRPRGAAWAPWPHTTRTPRRTATRLGRRPTRPSADD
jgi:SagB-type dehydrogenase family enzyme